jgi:GNAT superfamily N-acetyltransferase
MVDKGASGGWSLRRSLRSGELGEIVRLHGLVYQAEYGYDASFEAYVARDLGAFVESFDPRLDGLWLAEVGGRVVGFVAIAHQPDRVARLRWFLVDPSVRGRGLGRLLIESAVGFCREVGFGSVVLWTTSELGAAHRLYLSLGFVKVEEVSHARWGKQVTEECLELHLA